MKKEINSKSRRKWIMGGLAAFASVALLTTGFAVWLVGVQKTKANGDVTVNVDTAKNENIEFTAELADSKIQLGEPTEVSDTEKFVKTNTLTDETKQDFDISFKSFVIKIGQDVESQYDCVKFSLTATPIEGDGKTADVTYVDNLAVNDEIGTLALADSLGENKRVAKGTYFDLATTVIDLPKGETLDTATGLIRKQVSSYITYTMTENQKFTNFFKWGTFFGGASPCTFYNKVFADKNNQTIENADKVQKEFDDMYNKYNKPKTSICLHMELGKKPAKI